MDSTNNNNHSTTSPDESDDVVGQIMSITFDSSASSSEGVGGTCSNSGFPTTATKPMEASSTNNSNDREEEEEESSCASPFKNTHCETVAMSAATTTTKSSQLQHHEDSSNSSSIFRRTDEKDLEADLKEKGSPGKSSDLNQTLDSSLFCYTTSKSEDSSNNNQHHSLPPAKAAAAKTATTPPPTTTTGEDNIWLQVYQISLYSILGMTIRVYLERFMGLDCAMGEDGGAPQDFFQPFFSRICVTNTGETDQTGGALFIDLPANMLGCFLIGLLSNKSRPHHALPWLSPEHPLQKNAPYHFGLRVGLCGCLTTFASWNTQMIVMLDGSNTVLGPQVAAALFGYLIGLCASVSAFIFGQHAAEWFFNMHERRRRLRSNRTRRRQRRGRRLQADEGGDHDDRFAIMSMTSNEDDDLPFHPPEPVVPQDPPTTDDNKSSSRCSMQTFRDVYRRAHKAMCGVQGFLPPLFVLGLIGAFLAGDFVYGLFFYREMWMSALMSPIGALLRWRLKKFFNHKAWPCGCRNRTRRRRIHGSRSHGSGNCDNTASTTSRRSSMQRLSESRRRLSDSVMNMPVANVVWMPWGTVVANLLAVLVSALGTALTHRYYYNDVEHPWTHNLLTGLTTGFAGTLSTVSTFVVEIVGMQKPAQKHIYAFGSLACSMVLGLAIYSPIMRSSID